MKRLDRLFENNFRWFWRITYGQMSAPAKEKCCSSHFMNMHVLRTRFRTNDEAAIVELLNF